MRKHKKKLMRKFRQQYIDFKNHHLQIIRAFEQGFISGRIKQCQNQS